MDVLYISCGHTYSGKFGLHVRIPQLRCTDVKGVFPIGRDRLELRALHSVHIQTLPQHHRANGVLFHLLPLLAPYRTRFAKLNPVSAAVNYTLPLSENQTGLTQGKSN